MVSVIVWMIAKLISYIKMYFDKVLDVRGLVCPQPLLQTKKSLSAMASGTILRVLATDPGAVIDLKVFAEQDGHELIYLSEDSQEFIFHIRKKLEFNND